MVYFQKKISQRNIIDSGLHMNTAVKAALLSGLVFPGLGQLYLKQYWRGLVIIMLVMLGLMIVVGMATFSTLASMNKIQIEGISNDMNTIVNLASTYSIADVIYYKVIFLFIACCWFFSLIDAYRTGKRRSREI
jgi:TM2 domain-containing membrane protein YozV